ncbi:MAG: HEPN domain-containing protein [Candidatus Eremiobacteraeota bacterium]|nr:HEPN domain-containing protein [Candidatus Eremiobacteraeota bacterium]
MQPNKAVLAAEWRATAEEDLRVAMLLADESPSIAAFHAQQAAEKAVKAACVMLVDDAPRTHVVNFLLDELAENGVTVDDDVRDAARILERYYAPTRYPDALGGISPNRIYRSTDAADAIARAHIVLAFAARIMADDTA